MRLNSHPSGRHFLQIPGPTNVPDRILRAMDHPTIDHRGPEFNALAKKVLRSIRQVFQTKQPVIIYPASGTGAWEAALVNTLSAGDTVLMWETGHFASLWKKMADKLGIKSEFMGGDWRKPADPAAIEKRLKEDKSHTIKAVCIVHNETSTGVVTDVSAVRQAIDAAKHPALLLVDTISSLGSVDYRHDAWGVDVTVAGSQKGLMLPPGLSFNAISEKALAASKTPTAGSPTRRPPTSCTASTKPATCCWRKAWTPSLPATRATPRRRAPPSRPGASKSCAAIPRPTAAR